MLGVKPTADFCPCWPAPPDHRRPSKGRESAQGPVCPPPSPLGLFLTFFFLPSLPPSFPSSLLPRPSVPRSRPPSRPPARPPALSHSVLHIFFLICSLAHFIPPSLHPSLFETQRGRLSRGAVTAGSRPAAKTAAGGCDCLARDNTRRPHACAATARGGLRGALRLRRRDCPPPVASLASDCDAPSVPRAHSQKRLTPEFPFAGLRRPRGPCGGAGSGLVLTGARRPRGRLRLCIGSPGGPGGGG